MVTKVISRIYPYDYWYGWYQEYYRKGLSAFLLQEGIEIASISSTTSPRVLKILRQARDSGKLQRVLGPFTPKAKVLIDKIAAFYGGDYRPVAPLVGQYTFRLANDRDVNVCIDSHDSGEISSPELLNESDVYFKTNYWPSKEYDNRVVPFYNCNPTILAHLPTLRNLRQKPAEFDVCFVVRVWGGKSEEEGVEHCLRLLEAVAKVPGKKFLLAYLVTANTAVLADRLRRHGILSTTRALPVKELWEIAARSRLNVIRLGMHQCIPWRMCDLLALGSCPVLDQDPKTIWPEPLREGVQYWSMKVEMNSSQPIAEEWRYKEIPDLLRVFLEKKNERSEIHQATATYFDRHLEPFEIGRQICDRLCRQC